MQPADEPGESSWAELREAQTMTLSLPNTGMATIIDIGEAKDIHPRNKQDVGKRLALSALKVTYGVDVVASGPTFKEMQTDGNRVILSFDNVGSGLYLKNKYGYINGFALAGEDKKFYWAKAELAGDKIILVCPDVQQPAAVRYGWADNPDDLNLYNLEGLPAVPFRTDSWAGITEVSLGVKRIESNPQLKYFVTGSFNGEEHNFGTFTTKTDFPDAFSSECLIER